VVGDPDRLRQVLVNLVGNAVKFTDEGEVVLDVRPAGPITDEAEVLELCFEVRDTGPGIPETQLEEIFERFRQADSSSTRKHGGTGLGLAISAALVDLMGGRLGVESTEGRGSTFRFNALLSRGDEDGSAKAPAPEDVTGVRVLVVDDNGTNRLILTEMLEGWGARPRAVADGDTGLELLRRAREAGDPFGLILLDGHMPGKDGFQVAEEIRQDPSLGRSTIMMLTSAGSRRAELQRAHELGIERYMVKPIRRSQLLEAIRKSLGSNRAAGETPPPEAAPEDSGAGRRILLVEDAEENRMLIRAYLKRTSHELHEVANGEEAVEAVTADPDGWDLVLMDVQMPVMDGYEATRRIRAWEEERGRDRLPIAALTAHALRSERKKSAEAGCDEHVTKPIKKKELLETITRLTPDGALRRPEEVTP
jgi:CheY-like chemotaxis protein